MKKRHLPQRELQIAKRLREVRETLSLSQTEFANQIGISRERLASYEVARVPLRYDIALRLCRQFIIGEKWLATGQGNPREIMDLRHEPITSKIPADSPFSKAFDDVLAARYEEIAQESGGVLRIQMTLDDDYSFLDNLFKGVLTGWKHSLPKEELATFCYLLLEHGQWLMKRRPFVPWPEFLRDRAGGTGGKPQLSVFQGPKPQEESEDNNFPDTETYAIGVSVKAQLPKLLERIREATAESGSKSALAEFLGVPLASVSRWLSREREPGGEYVLQLLQWVEQQERKSK